MQVYKNEAHFQKSYCVSHLFSHCSALAKSMLEKTELGYIENATAFRTTVKSCGSSVSGEISVLQKATLNNSSLCTVSTFAAFEYQSEISSNHSSDGLCQVAH